MDNIWLFIKVMHADEIEDFWVSEDPEIRPNALWNWEQPFHYEV